MINNSIFTACFKVFFGWYNFFPFVYILWQSSELIGCNSLKCCQWPLVLCYVCVSFCQKYLSLVIVNPLCLFSSTPLVCENQILCHLLVYRFRYLTSMMSFKHLRVSKTLQELFTDQRVSSMYCLALVLNLSWFLLNVHLNIEPLTLLQQCVFALFKYLWSTTQFRS